MTRENNPHATSLIVGAGPVGLMMAVLLARQGLTSVVVERYKTRHGAPKAHALNPRTLEICRAIGLDTEAMARRGTPAQDGGWVRFMTTLSGNEIGVLPYERQDEAVRAFTPTPLINLAQPLFEDFLLEMVVASPLIEVRRGVSWVSCQQDDGVVTSVLEDVETRERTTFTSRYLIGSDGAGSVVRRELDVPMVGDSEPQPFITIHFEANLRALVRERPGILYWIMQPPHAGVLIAYDIDGRWCMLYPHDPSVMPREAFTPAVCMDILRHVTGVPESEIEIKHILPWIMVSEVAERYRVEQAFLVGDAAHRFPPMGGLGLNTGIQDAHNLAWKIGAVERHEAGAALLDSYEAERRGVALTNADQSIKNAQRILGLRASLELRADDTPEELARRLRDPAVKAEVERQIARQREHFDSLDLQLGFSYDRAHRHNGSISDFTAELAIGKRLPHVWLERDGRAVSSLDLVDDRVFTVLAGPGAADALRASDMPSPVRVLVEGRDFVDAHHVLGRSLGLSDAAAVLVRPDGHVAEIFRDLGRAAVVQGDPVPSELAPDDMARGDLLADGASRAIAASLAANLSLGLTP